MTVMERSRAIELVPRCGAKTRSRGEPCEKTAGWGTDHQGFGECRLHGGSTKAGRTKAARLMAVARAREDLGEVDITALDAADYNVRRVHARVLFCRGMMALHDVGSPAWLTWYEMEGEALRDHRQSWKGAVDVGVATHLMRITEQQTSVIAAAFERAMMRRPNLSKDDRTELLAEFVDGLELAEHTDIEGTAS